MTRPATYTRGERAELRLRAREGQSLLCPRCAVPLGARAIHPTPQVGYVRTRVWWSCERCGRSAVLDDRTRGHGRDELARDLTDEGDVPLRPGGEARPEGRPGGTARADDASTTSVSSGEPRPSAGRPTSFPPEAAQRSPATDTRS